MEQGKQGATMLKGSPQQLQNPIEQIQTRYKHLENGFKLWLSKQKMEQGKQGAMVLNASPQEEIRDPVERIQIQFQTRYKQLENGFNLWLSKQSIAVEAAAVTATTAAKWFAVGALATPFVFTMPWDVSDVSFKNMTPAHQDFIQRPLIPAQNLAVVAGVNAGIRCVFKRLRGKEDVLSSMAAGFGSGAMFSLLFGMGGPVSIGIQFAMAQAGNFKMDESLSRHADETRNMKKDFKRGLLLPLLNDSVLRDVKISLLLILDHIQREQDLREKRGSRR